MVAKSNMSVNYSSVSLSLKGAGEEVSGLTISLGIVLVSLCLVVTITGDCFVYAAFYTKRNVRSRVNVFFLSLVTADMCLAMLVMPLELAHLSYEPIWPLGVTAANIWNSLFVCFGTASVCSLAAISVDRYLVITRPLCHHTTTISNKSLLVVLFLWLYAFASAGYSFFIWTNPSGYRDVGFNIPLSHAMILMSANLLLPFTICVVLYYRIFKISLQQSSQIAPMFTWNKEEHHARMARDRKSAKTLSLLVGTFALSTLPFYVFHAVDAAFNESLPGRENASHVVKWLCYVNSASNWALYGFFDRAFRDALLSVASTCWGYLKLADNRIVPFKDTETQKTTRPHGQSNE